MESVAGIHCVIKGRVQGVFYRQSAITKAKALNLTGWIKNLPNGDVELVACGDKEALQLLQQWLWKGPKLANVTEIIINDQPMCDYVDFTQEV